MIVALLSELKELEEQREQEFSLNKRLSFNSVKLNDGLKALKDIAHYCAPKTINAQHWVSGVMAAHNFLADIRERAFDELVASDKQLEHITARIKQLDKLITVERNDRD